MVNNTEHIIRVAIYTRVSSQEQADNGTSLETSGRAIRSILQGSKMGNIQPIY